MYLFREDGAGFYIKLAQGVTSAERELGAKAFDVLAAQAARIREAIPALAEDGFDLSGKSYPGTNAKKARLYEASTIASKYYLANAIPDDSVLLEDLDLMLDAYEHVVGSGVTKSLRGPLALVGTWKTVISDLDSVSARIVENGAWASPWSFKVKEEARRRLEPPFTLFINGGGGQIVARAKVVAAAFAPDPSGMTTPWDDITDPEFRGRKRFDHGTQEPIKTWLKILAIELITPIRAYELSLADGLSTPENLLNQNAFGYVFDIPTSPAAPEVPTTTSQEPDSIFDPPDFDWLVEQTMLAPAVLEEMVGSLSTSSPQILLAGLPGTSKTWVAKRLAEFVTVGSLYQSVAFATGFGSDRCCILGFVTDERPTLPPAVPIGSVTAMAFAWCAHESSSPKTSEQNLVAELSSWLKGDSSP